MRDYERHPEPTDPNLGLQCLRAVTIDHRFDDRVRLQAAELLALAVQAPGDCGHQPARFFGE